MGLVDEVAVRGGYARTCALLELGYSERDLGQAVRAGRLHRPRKGWLTRPGLDPQLLLAVKHGVMLSCVTQARRLGLWVSEQPAHPHVAARGPKDRPSLEARVHWGQPLLPRDPHTVTDPLPNVLNLVARCLPFEHALATWESAFNKGLTDRESMARLALAPAAARVLDRCTPFSDSGLETLFKTRLRWLNVPIRAQIWLHGHRIDFLVGDCLVIQVDGKQHAGAQRLADLAHDNELRKRGYVVIRVSYAQIMHDWPAVQEAVMCAVAAGQHRWPRSMRRAELLG